MAKQYLGFLLTILIALFFKSCLVVFCQVECHDSYSCDSQTIITNDNVDCEGYFSCHNSSIAISGSNDVDIDCYASYSCYKAQYLDITTTSGDYNIDCYGLFSCAYVNYMHNFVGNIDCQGELSCTGSNIYGGNDEGRVDCYGDRACLGATISSSYYNRFFGHLSGHNSRLYGNFTNALFEMHGSNAGYDATIICSDGYTCNVDCNGNACNDLTLQCNSTNGCDFSVTCDYAERSDLCPNGYQLPITSPNLVNVTFSTYNNSVYPCLSNITNAIMCDDKDECSNLMLDTSENVAPICCTADKGCDGALNITSKIPSNSSIIDNVSIRCDARFSCDGVNSMIYAKNGGNMYFAGRRSMSGSGDGIVQNNGNYDIICSGTHSCRETSLIQKALNLYCMGLDSCYAVTLIRFMDNVYGYGYSSLEQATICNIFDSVYCAAYQSCQQSTITNVNNNVYGGGYRALYNSTINNVTNLYCGGLQCCQGCDIKSVNNIYIDGENALSGSTIMSGLDNGETMIVTINGTNSNAINIYCNISNTCKIKCLSNDACNNIYFYCFESGTCWVDCFNNNDNNCLTYGNNYDEWTTETSTSTSFDTSYSDNGDMAGVDVNMSNTTTNSNEVNDNEDDSNGDDSDNDRFYLNVDINLIIIVGFICLTVVIIVIVIYLRFRHSANLKMKREMEMKRPIRVPKRELPDIGGTKKHQTRGIHSDIFVVNNDNGNDIEGNGNAGDDNGIEDLYNNNNLEGVPNNKNTNTNINTNTNTRQETNNKTTKNYID